MKKESEIVRDMLPKKKTYKFFISPLFWVLPGYKVDNQFQYPTLVHFQAYPLEKMQPFRMGFRNFSMMACFGEMNPMLIGDKFDRELNQLDLSLDQFNPRQKIAKIVYVWQEFELDQHKLFYYELNFYSKDNTLIGAAQNIAHNKFQRVKKKYKFVVEKTEECHVNDDEIIVGLIFGMRASTSVVNFQFILQKV